MQGLESTSQMRILIHNCWGGFYTFLFNPTTSLPLRFPAPASAAVTVRVIRSPRRKAWDDWLHLCLSEEEQEQNRPGLSVLQFACNFSKCSEEGNPACCHESCKEGNYLIAESIWFLKSTGRLLQRRASEIHTVGEGASWGKKETLALITVESLIIQTAKSGR